jgi:CelD/BcsL family acetyltransferase involved in cellulose biosynthesis
VGGAGALAAEGTRAALMEALFRLHGRQWKEKGGEGVLAAPAVRRHHLDAAAALDHRGALRLHGLEQHGELVGVVYGFLFRRRLWMYLSGFAPELAAFSPGSILIERALGAACAEGAVAMDFLRGDEAYKLRWGTRARRTWRVDIARAG